MDIPRGHAMLPLNESDFLDFIFNYFKAEYAPIRSFWSTATADPRQPQRWVNMGHELQPLTLRAANAQAQKDIDSLCAGVIAGRGRIFACLASAGSKVSASCAHAIEQTGLKDDYELR